MTRSHLECHRRNSIWQLSNAHMHRHTHQHKCVLLEPMYYWRPPRFSKHGLFIIVRMKNIITHIYIIYDSSSIYLCVFACIQARTLQLNYYIWKYRITHKSGCRYEPRSIPQLDDKCATEYSTHHVPHWGEHTFNLILLAEIYAEYWL